MEDGKLKFNISKLKAFLAMSAIKNNDFRFRKESEYFDDILDFLGIPKPIEEVYKYEHSKE